MWGNCEVLGIAGVWREPWGLLGGGLGRTRGIQWSSKHAPS